MKILRWFRNGLVGVGALALSGGVIAVADYFATQPGSGTSFASVVISSVHYAAMVVCDATIGETRCATVDASGRISVTSDVLATAAKQPALGTAGTASANVLTVQGIASMTPLTVTGAAGTFPVTQSTSPWIVAGGGTAGTAASGVLTVQGIASMTPLLANPGTAASWGVVAQGSTTSGQSGNLVQCAVTTSAPTYTTAQTDPLSCDTTGALRVTGATSNGAIKVNLTVAPTGACTPVHYLSAVSTNSTSVKASAGTLCSVTIINNTATAASFRLYDTASAPTCSSATGAVANYGVQANTTSPGMSPNLGPFALAFTTGIGFCLTAYDGTDTNNSNSVTGIQINLGYN